MTQTKWPPTNPGRFRLAAGEDAEAEALICNPSVSDKLLEELYGRTGAFATLAEERWRNLIYLSRKNERLVTEEDSHDMPDMGHYRIHHAIFRLLEIAPVHSYWLIVLYGLLDQLDFQHVANPEAIEAVLSRWAKLDDNDGGYFTSLSLKDEFRCLHRSLVWPHLLRQQVCRSGQSIRNGCSDALCVLWERTA